MTARDEMATGFVHSKYHRPSVVKLFGCKANADLMLFFGNIQLLNEFTDVNNGEKAMMKLWNDYVLKER